MKSDANNDWHRISGAQNVPIALRQSGHGDPVVFVHGTAARAGRWLKVASAFEPTNRVIEFDRRGRGESGDHAEYSLAAEASDLLEVLKYTGDGAPVNVVAHSYGALISLMALGMDVSVFGKLVLYEAPLAFDNRDAFIDPELVDQLELEYQARGELAATEHFLRNFPRVTERELEQLRGMASWSERVSAAHTLVRELRSAHEFMPEPETLQSCRVPCLLLLGGESIPAFHESARRLAELLPDSQLTVLPGQRHRAMDTVPALMFEIINEFLQPHN